MQALAPYNRILDVHRLTESVTCQAAINTAACRWCTAMSIFQMRKSRLREGQGLTMATGSVYSGRPNKVPQTGWLKIYFLSVLEARSLWSRCWQVWFLLWPLSLASRWPPSPCVLTQSACPVCKHVPGVSVHPNFLILQGHRLDRIKGHPCGLTLT